MTAPNLAYVGGVSDAALNYTTCKEHGAHGARAVRTPCELLAEYGLQTVYSFHSDGKITYVGENK